MTAIPGLLQNQHAYMTVCTQLAQNPLLTQASTISTAGSELRPSRKISSSRTFKRQIWASSSLERFGIYRWKSAQYIRCESDKRYGHQNTTDDIISTSYDLVLNWRFLKYGVQWVRQYPCGYIPSSLNVYPIVENIDMSFHELIESAPISKVQRMFSSGALHPFIRNTSGWSLLHVSSPSEKLVIDTNRHR
jgi:hypothetical protein